jgi:hypothetical protein
MTGGGRRDQGIVKRVISQHFSHTEEAEVAEETARGHCFLCYLCFLCVK